MGSTQQSFAELAVDDVAARLGYAVRRNAITPCPACHATTRGSSDRRNPIGVTPNQLGWRCHSCKEGGGAVTFACFAVVGNRLPKDDPRWRSVMVAIGATDATTTATSAAKAPELSQRSPDEFRRPRREEVAEVWGRAVSVDSDAEVRNWIRNRGLDYAGIVDRDLMRALPTSLVLPAWARFPLLVREGSASWLSGPQQFRMIVPMFGATGEIESVHVRALHPTDPKGRDKAASPAGAQVGGLVMADSLARRVLRADADAVEMILRNGLVIAEGEPDYLTFGTTFPDDVADTAPGVIGVIAGSWSDEIASRIPTSCRVVVWTHHDEAGAKYATKIIATLHRRCVVSRSRAT